MEYTGRKRVPIKKKLNPVWWFGNDHEQKVTDPDAAWYSTSPRMATELMWSLRNPLQNFRAYVIGVQDRNYRVKVVRGHPDANVVQRDDVGEFKDGRSQCSTSHPEFSFHGYPIAEDVSSFRPAGNRLVSSGSSSRCEPSSTGRHHDRPAATWLALVA